jgi:hypothetical protein
MMRTLIKAVTMGVVGARILPAVLVGAANTVAAMLTAYILFTTFVGLTPLLLIAQGLPGPRGAQPDPRSASRSS